MRRKIRQQKNLYDWSPLSTFLKQKKISNYMLARVLNMDNKTIAKYLIRPAHSFNLHEMIVIAGMTNSSLIDIVALIRGISVREGKKWFDNEKGLDADKLNEII